MFRKEGCPVNGLRLRFTFASLTGFRSQRSQVEIEVKKFLTLTLASTLTLALTLALALT